jgi:hypothetical protein
VSVVVEQFIGTYQGTGAWHDEAGKSSGYRIRQTNTPSADGFEIAFKHDFDDGTVVNAQFQMIRIAPNLFRVETNGAAIGNGYVFGGYCHYHVKPGAAFVEASYRASGNDLEVFGSSSTNAEGHYIAWAETLHRVHRSADL